VQLWELILEPLGQGTQIPALTFVHIIYLMIYSYHFAFTSDPSKLYPNGNWVHAPPEGKTLTEILLKRDLSVVAFGFEARFRFAAEEDHSDLLYFANFKTILHNKVLGD
jgi:hypothetical protein